MVYHFLPEPTSLEFMLEILFKARTKLCALLFLCAFCLYVLLKQILKLRSSAKDFGRAFLSRRKLHSKFRLNVIDQKHNQGWGGGHIMSINDLQLIKLTLGGWYRQTDFQTAVCFNLELRLNYSTFTLKRWPEATLQLTKNDLKFIFQAFFLGSCYVYSGLYFLLPTCVQCLQLYRLKFNLKQFYPCYRLREMIGGTCVMWLWYFSHFCQFVVKCAFNVALLTASNTASI